MPSDDAALIGAGAVARGIVVLLGTAPTTGDGSKRLHPRVSKPMAKQQKWYVVWAGHEPGVYETWAECQRQTQGYPKALFKSFESRSEALRAYEEGFQGFSRRHRAPSGMESSTEAPIEEALAVDAACSGNPGVMEYRGVYLPSRRVIFEMGPFPKGTNNIGEFLAIVHALALIEKQGLSQLVIYSDSQTALGWVRKKRCKTLLERTAETAPLFDLIERAERWLQTHTYTTPLYKWDTVRWGEIPADYGRKG